MKCFEPVTWRTQGRFVGSIASVRDLQLCTDRGGLAIGVDVLREVQAFGAFSGTFRVAVLMALVDCSQRRLRRIVFSILSEKLGRSASLSVESAIAATGRLTLDHLRSARTLLNGSMSDLALPSGLLISTIERVEREPQDVARRSDRLVVDTLRGCGICFVTVDGAR